MIYVTETVGCMVPYGDSGHYLLRLQRVGNENYIWRKPFNA